MFGKSNIERETLLSKTIDHEKNLQRKAFRALRKEIDETRRYVAKKDLYAYLKVKLEPFKKVLSFVSFGYEIDLSLVNEMLEKEGKLHCPKVIRGQLVGFKITNIATQMRQEKYRFKEPNMKLCQVESQFDCILVPGLAFDKEGNRIGYGKGHYDMLLRDYPEALSIGVGFREQLSHEPLPVTPLDQKVVELCLV